MFEQLLHNMDIHTQIPERFILTSEWQQIQLWRRNKYIQLLIILFNGVVEVHWLIRILGLEYLLFPSTILLLLFVSKNEENTVKSQSYG